MIGRALGLAAALALTLPVAASATTFHGAAVDDPATTVTLRVSKAGVVGFSYSDVLVTCSNGDEVREPGADHSTTLGDDDRFKDVIEQDLEGGATGKSLVRGRIRGRRARGVLAYDLLYDGGECHSGKLRWKAKRKVRRVNSGAARLRLTGLARWA